MPSFFTTDTDKVIAAISNRLDGDLSFKWGSAAADVVKNRHNFLGSLGLNLNNLVTVNQPHGNEVLVVQKESLGRGAFEPNWLLGYDGLVTSDPNIILGVETADCVPIFLFDKENEVVGLAHAGWRGVVADIASSLIEKSLTLGAKVDSLKIIIGPHIKECCFEIQEDIVSKFTDIVTDSVEKRREQLFVNLSKILQRQLTRKGVLAENITVSSDCTCCLEKVYNSYRREKNNCQGSMLSIIKLNV